MERSLEPEKVTPTKVKYDVQGVIEDIADWAGKLSVEKQKALGAELKKTITIKDKAKRTAAQLEIFRKHGAPADKVDTLKELWK